jgi:hypothetical protein
LPQVTTIIIDVDATAPWGSISPGMRDGLVEAARVMLDRFHPAARTRGSWTSEVGTAATEVHWSTPTEVMRSTHANMKDATEDGAYTLAVLAAHHLGLRVLGRAPQGSGADWFVQDPGRPTELMKLEVSGIATGGSPGSRLSQKLEQGMGGNIVADGLAVVFRFQDASLHSRRWG